ncbi:MAG: OmpH family outer membrane protein [Bdellovibrio sp.]
MNRVILAGLATLIMSTAIAETKIGFVDVQKAIKATAAGKKATTELETEFNKEKKGFEKKEADIKVKSQDLEKKKAVLSEETYKTKQAEIQKEIMAFRDELAKSQNDIQKKQEDLIAPILEKMEKVIAKVSKEKGFSMVLQDTRMIVYSTPDMDLTNDVIKAYDLEK